MTTGRIVIIGLVVVALAAGAWLWMGRSGGSGAGGAAGIDTGKGSSGEEQPPLHVAAQQGNVEETRRLIAEGSDVNVRDKWGITTLHRAVGMGQTEVVKVLLEAGADASAAEPEGGMTPLHSAANRGQTAAARLLLEAGADVNAKANGVTPLSLALSRGNTQVANLLRENGGTE